MKKGVFIFVLWLSSVVCASAQFLSRPDLPPPAPQKVLDISRVEYFEYEVDYGPFFLGTIRVFLMPDTLFKGKPAYHLRCEMRSNERLWFVGYKEEHYQSFLRKNDTTFFEVYFWSHELHKNRMYDLEYELDYDNQAVYSFEDRLPVDTLHLAGPAISGPGIFLISRLFAGTNQLIDVPVYLDHMQSNITVHYQANPEKRFYKAFPDSILTFPGAGKANFDGPFGFNGVYKAWWGTDEYRIPLEAHAKVWIGSVKVRLSKYELKKDHASN